ncbi:triose-phosphate isomerase [Pseudooceanicola sp. CBS1P-1]|uniref:Triosephosphate isomerase n=1 Tax=Pseudooceanicola albus TaxID=2692189 RepID=A0A6L7G0E5_9RHOB|nr:MULTISPECIES: triose-phosphate isomerase [Pseudooceanicola]MBT9382459.1 triose-phosphate isomerase [Pseudooceanicola endophyticus]MXN17000.1 triose-phosphate isomerase [Pseudooceanicola albus]
MRRKLAAGNWKMNGMKASLAEIEALAKAHPDPACDLLICPPATLIAAAAEICQGTGVKIGGQTCHDRLAGAHTGDISATMLKDAGASAVILGHSERREDHEESSEDVRMLAKTAQSAGLMTVVCVGESLFQRQSTNTLDIIGAQLSLSIPDSSTGENLIVAYEPIWAIGSGLTPTKDEIGEVHDFMRARLEHRFGYGVGKSVRLLYGGSVKGSNAEEIFSISNVDGALVGGASLTAEDFGPIVSALEKA